MRLLVNEIGDNSDCDDSARNEEQVCTWDLNRIPERLPGSQAPRELVSVHSFALQTSSSHDRVRIARPPKHRGHRDALSLARVATKGRLRVHSGTSVASVVRPAVSLIDVLVSVVVPWLW